MKAAWLPLSARLEQLLDRPPNGDPLYERMAHMDPPNGWWGWAPYVALGLVALAMFSLPASMALAVGLLAALPLFFPARVNLRSARWAMDIRAALARERRHGRDDLLGILPPGPLGCRWTVALACIHRDDSYRESKRQLRTALMLALPVLALAWLIAVVGVGPARSGGDLASVAAQGQLLELVALLGLLALDARQTPVLGVLVGLAGAERLQGGFDVPLWAGLSFLSIQMSLYAATALVGYVVLPAVVASVGAQGVGRIALLYGLRLALLCGAREVVIRVLWGKQVVSG